MSADATRVAFSSAAFNLAHADAVENPDVFVWTDCAALSPVCADGTRTVGCERCDDGDLDSGDGCDSNCRYTGCGNGVQTAGEQCDDGGGYSGDGCSYQCQTEVLLNRDAQTSVNK